MKHSLCSVRAWILGASRRIRPSLPDWHQTSPEFFLLTMPLWGFVIAGGLISSATGGDDFPPADLFAQLDQNRDGKLTADEIPAGQYRFFERILRLGDQNQDGNISLEELKIALKEPLKGESKPEDQEEATKNSSVPESERRPRLDQILERFDRNNDGFVSRDEIPQEIRNRFDPLFEKTSSEKISLEKLRQFTAPSKMPPTGDDPENPPIKGDWMGRDRGLAQPDAGRFRSLALIRLLDRDQNGTLSQKELEKAGEVFQQLDTNGDGELTSRELIGLGTLFLPRDGAAPREMSFPDELFRRLDANEDGFVSKEEAPARLRDSFSEFDTDNDGKISPAEMRTGLPRLRRQGTGNRQ